ncbi:glycerophosphodiester phosphodiesterase [Metabacillus sp. GX 13764]|uniref:glycerophosphodiester phosphodiesterase n=1 Tax=Metabacillus kandeliae TaxID=2900151 RepID=UPI001E34121B|nr:glycerophosphodiester phosphodiesterase [Metabacillus kandeliae]MCD7033221.1 glycerophosphodiester phosphodiesterase [Metabacillus kandeliae]
MTKIFGHRGAAGTYPENTMLSFKEAINAGADGIELDVHLTKDGVPVVIHDETVDRTTDGSGNIIDLTFDELREFNAASHFPSIEEKHLIPSLEEVLDWAASSKDLFLVNIELKNDVVDYPGLEEKVIEMAAKHQLENRLILSSFNHYSLLKCLKTNPQIETAVLYMEGLYQPYNYARKIGARSLHPALHAAKPDIIQQSEQSGFSVRPFTVNDEEDMLRLLESGCSGFITDYPEKAIALRKQQNG